MKKAEILKEIEELKRRVEALEDTHARITNIPTMPMDGRTVTSPMPITADRICKWWAEPGYIYVGVEK